MLVLRSQFFEYLRETLNQTCLLEHLGAARLSSYGKRLTIIDLVEGL